MDSSIDTIFQDEKLVNKIKNKLPYLFQLAEEESSRAGKLGMEVGSARERVIIALLMHKFGEANVNANIPITEKEVDVKVFEKPVSIKTITGFGGVKLVWTVDATKSKEFLQNYKPKSDIILVNIKWGDKGGFYHVPKKAQERTYKKLGRDRYMKLPKPGTNPRGVELSKDALLALTKDNGTKSIEIRWERKEISYNPYKRWIEYWKDD